MAFALWSVLIGLLLILMALGASVLARLPLSTAMLYLAVGVAVSPIGLDWQAPTPFGHTRLLERMAEVVVLVSLFGAGLKLSPGLADRRWLAPVRLATVSMLFTAAGVALAGWGLLGLPLGAALVLGGILAPTDPVLASDVQVQDPRDQDELRFALTGEGGLNDGTAFPVVLLGLGLLGQHELGAWGWRWWAVDVVWSAACGVAVGAGFGLAVGRLVLYLRREHKEAVGLDDFLALGLVALAYGGAILLHGSGFLAVFAAGVALRRLVQAQSPPPEEERRAVVRAAASPAEDLADSMAVDPKLAPAFMARAVLGFNEQIERIAEVAAVVAIGAVLWAVPWREAQWWFVPLLLLVIRPLSVLAGLAGTGIVGARRRLVGWFGIRGVGSLYYLMYAINHGLSAGQASQLAALTLSVVVASIVLHGISVTPLMARYERLAARGGRSGPPAVLQPRQRQADGARNAACLESREASHQETRSMPSDNPSESRQPPAERRTDRSGRTLPPDLQPEDAGTPASGQPPGRGTAAQPATKETSKTEHERGSR